MKTLIKGLLATLGAVALAGPAVAQFGGPPAPPNTGVPLYTELTGKVGHGYATVVVDPPKGTACYIINVSGLDNITAAHIHIGGPTEAGDPVLTLDTPVGDDDDSEDCQDIDRGLAQAIVRDPGNYYVNVHTGPFPQGAIRGQLSK